MSGMSGMLVKKVARKPGPVLECDTCGKPFTSSGNSMPRLLPCTHTYCHGCLSRYVKEGKPVTLSQYNIEVDAVDCPRGCGPAPVGTAGASALPANTVLIARLNRTSDVLQLPTCEECERKDIPADMWCDNCDAYFCKTHFANMHASKVGKRHRTMRASERPMHALTRCTEHAGQEVVLFCRTHSTAVCRDCCSVPFNGEHAACTVVPLDVAAEEATQALREAIKNMRGELLTSLQESLKEIQTQLAAVDALSITAERDIEKAFMTAEANVVIALKERKEELLKNAEEISASKKVALSTQANEVGSAAAGLNTVCGETEAELRADATAALKRSNQLVNRLETIREQANACRLEPLATASLTTSMPQTELASFLCQVVQEYGTIEDV
eukprot:TRINITY_DN46544_c0_g1_i1.p1 TRINITY_DN46544_c0_g1~~TRINITY_DN46544_c0_g1_i1.p1  ORF type:complete len:386 (+),score=97.30 TRINITY_DN46544_c0_g1_i1:61-1218(+)